MAKLNDQRQKEQEKKLTEFMEDQQKKLETMFKPAATMKPPREALEFQQMLTKAQKTEKSEEDGPYTDKKPKPQTATSQSVLPKSRPASTALISAGTRLQHMTCVRSPTTASLDRDKKITYPYKPK